ncbi:MAG: hypothetical protein LE180_00695 [Endomicrobium sp.]|uniref:hypothetical protein n=1 Tax=Candidatus Endomicrobiellum pyrsonymphae TaxID=1408203 RepID=UPI0035789FD0|nr:hypothetical protein [Endomicrobium sp.]
MRGDDGEKRERSSQAEASWRQKIDKSRNVGSSSTSSSNSKSGAIAVAAREELALARTWEVVRRAGVWSALMEAEQ